MIDWLTNNPIDGLIAAAIAVVGGSYLPWSRLTSLLPKRTGKTNSDAHEAIGKLLDVIHTVSSHGDDETAGQLGEMVPKVIVACNQKTDAA